MWRSLVQDPLNNEGDNSLDNTWEMYKSANHKSLVKFSEDAMQVEKLLSFLMPIHFDCIYFNLFFTFSQTRSLTSERRSRIPRTLGPSSGGVSKATDVTIRARTATITSRAIKIPRQFLWFGLAETSSYHKYSYWHVNVNLLTVYVYKSNSSLQWNHRNRISIVQFLLLLW